MLNKKQFNRKLKRHNTLVQAATRLESEITAGKATVPKEGEGGTLIAYEIDRGNEGALEGLEDDDDDVIVWRAPTLAHVAA